MITGDTFELKIKTGCGLKKTDGELDFDKSVIGTTASDISNTPSGTISATNVQDAINELDTEKAVEGGSPTFHHFYIKEGVEDPTPIAGYTQIYVSSADGKLYAMFSSGIKKEIQYLS